MRTELCGSGGVQASGRSHGIRSACVALAGLLVACGGPAPREQTEAVTPAGNEGGNATLEELGGPCQPASDCWTVDANGTRNPEGTSIAQCTGTFPDYVVPATLIPDGFQGPWFQMAQDFPQTQPDGDPPPWAAIDFEAGVSAANEYLYALRDYAFEGNIEVDFRVQENPIRSWFTVPYMNYGPGRREMIHGVTAERTLKHPELGIRTGVTVRNYAIGFYDERGGYTIGQVWAEAGKPDLGASHFVDGAMVFKILFSDATPEDFEDPASYILEGAPEWQVATSAGVTTVRLLQMDVAVRDDRAQPSGWVFGTFAYDRDAPDESPWLRLRPVGLQWGNAPGYTPTQQQQGDPLPENTVSDQIPAYAAGHLGWAGRVNGPVDNPISACMSCHGTAQYPVDAPMAPFGSACQTDSQKLHWFRNLPEDEAFGAVDSSTCEPESVDPPAVPLDFSLQLQVSTQSILQYRDVNPCLEPQVVVEEEMALEELGLRSSDAPRVGRDGFFEEDD